ncbi:AI-2E family transporter [Ancrocorticia populi]|uniref:AI-2E family transporter n=1 Tax=Ancrocorticia populi TaxID=2175228 RepID=UPI0023534008|nr:AI-2E family transporter [Ancrocorticia populi]
MAKNSARGRDAIAALRPGHPRPDSPSEVSADTAPHTDPESTPQEDQATPVESSDAPEQAGTSRPHQPPAPPAARLQVSATSANNIPAGMKILAVAALATLACAGLYQIRDMVAPAFFALTLVLTVRPIHRWLLGKGVPVWLSAVVTITTLVGTLLVVVGLMAWSLVGLPELIRGYAPAFQNLVNQALEFAERQGLQADQITTDLFSKFDFGQAVNTVTNVVNSLSSAGALIALVALALLFITIDTQIVEQRAFVVKRHDSTFFQALSSFEGRVRQYWLVSTVFGLIVAVFNGAALQILDVPLPVAWALFSFITNYIPNIGFVIGVIPPALLGVLDSGWITGVWVVVAYCVFNAVIQGVFQPKFTGDAVGLSTTVTFLSLVFWTFIIGPLGAILAVPLTLFAKALLIDSSVQTRWMEAFLIPEGEARKKEADGYYDEESPSPDTFIDLTAQDSEERKKIQRTLRSLSLRSLRARTEK